MSRNRSTLILLGAIIVLCMVCGVFYQLYKVLTWEHVTFSIGIFKLILEAIFWVFVLGVIVALVTNRAPIPDTPD